MDTICHKVAYFMARSWHARDGQDTTLPTHHARRFGSIRKLPSGRLQARYTGPDGQPYTAPVTFTTRRDADTFLATVRTDIARATWLPPTAGRPPVPTLDGYASDWLAARDLKPRTRQLYAGLLDRHILPSLGEQPLTAFTPALVRTWYADTATLGPTVRAHAYALLRTILGTAVDDDILAANPCRVRGAGATTRVKQIKPASLAELETLVTAMPERLRLIVLLAAWCGLRFGELAELRRSDVDTRRGVLHVRRGVVRVGGENVVGTPKSTASVRDVAIPPHLVPLVREHKLAHAGKGRDGLLFPSDDGTSHLLHASLYKPYKKARKAAGRPDLRFHDLRHTGAVLAAQTGATLAELMSRLGHSTPGAALRYQHAAAGRDLEIARKLSALVDNG
jgi:integrase